MAINIWNHIETTCNFHLKDARLLFDNMMHSRAIRGRRQPAQPAQCAQLPHLPTHNHFGNVWSDLIYKFLKITVFNINYIEIYGY